MFYILSSLGHFSRSMLHFLPTGEAHLLPMPSYSCAASTCLCHSATYLPAHLSILSSPHCLQYPPLPAPACCLSAAWTLPLLPFLWLFLTAVPPLLHTTCLPPCSLSPRSPDSLLRQSACLTFTRCRLSGASTALWLVAARCAAPRRLGMPAALPLRNIAHRACLLRAVPLLPLPLPSLGTGACYACAPLHTAAPPYLYLLRKTASLHAAAPEVFSKNTRLCKQQRHQKQVACFR